MNLPDAIVIFSAGIVATRTGDWRPTTYEDSDSFGTLGGYDRVRAAVLLAKKYPRACLVTTSRRMTNESPTLAGVYAEELCRLGVSAECIIKEEDSINTSTAVENIVRLAVLRGWRKIIFLSSEFHLPRIQAFLNILKSDISVVSVSSESVLAQSDKTFTKSFMIIKNTSAYRTRLVAEERGIKAIKDGSYLSASYRDKKERLV